MGRPKKPMALREAHGTADRNKQRNNDDAPNPTKGIGEAPDYFDDQHRDNWDYLVENCHSGMLGNTDRPTFEIMTVLFTRFRKSFADPESGLNSADLTRMCGLMGSYGMTPSDRAKICVKKSDKGNPFAAV